MTDVNIADLYPIHSNEEGDLFREWVNDYYPYYAKHVELGRTGDYKNGYIQQAYFELGDEYERSQQHSKLRNNIGSLLLVFATCFSPPLDKIPFKS